MRTPSAAILRAALLDSERRGTADTFLARLSPEELDFIQYDWEIWARDDQLPPDDTLNPQGCCWTTWLILAGRGAGKTRAGAEWVRAQALANQPGGGTHPARIALIGETLADVRSVMVEGFRVCSPFIRTMSGPYLSRQSAC